MVRTDRPIRDDVNRSAIRREVRTCLTHLHDLPFLQAHGLSRRLDIDREADHAPEARLRNLLVEAVEGLRPASGTDGASRAWRRYQAVLRRYVDGESVPSVCSQLGISQSEFYRLIREGLEGATTTVCRRLATDDRLMPDGDDRPTGLSATRPDRMGTKVSLVGRARELDLLVDEFEQVKAGGGGRTLILRGPAGVGKTRLAEELGGIVKQRGGLLLTGRYFKEGYVPYDAWLEAIGPALARLPEEVVWRFREMHPELVQLFPELCLGPPSPAAARILDEQERRRRMFDGVARLLGSLSERQPVVLFLDDVHWASGLPLFCHVVRRVGTHRIVVIAAARDQDFEPDSNVAIGLAELVRSRLAREITIRRLSREDTATLVSALVGAPVSDRLHEVVFRKTLGNPLFVEELLQSMREADAIQPTDGGWCCVTADDPPIPFSLCSLLEGRIRRLSPGTRDMLAIGAVLGERFSGSVLQTMFEGAEPRLLSALEEALDTGFIVDESSEAQEAYRFADPLVREVVYERVPGPTRRRLHLGACESIKALFPDELERFTEELARHYAKASKPRAGADYAFRAGARAEDVFAWERAIPWYEMALSLWDDAGGPPGRQAEACLRLGKVYQQSAIDPGRGTELLQRALQLFQQLGDWPETAKVHAELGRAYMLGADVAQIDTERAARHLDAARSILEKLPVSAEVAQVYLALALAQARLVRLPASIDWARRAHGVGLRLRRPEVIAEALISLGGHITATGDASRGLALLDDGWRLASTEGLAVEADYCRHAGTWLSGVSLKNPRVGLRWAERQPDHHTIWSTVAVQSHLVAIRTMLGDFQGAADLFQELRARRLAIGQPVFGHFPNNPGLYLLRVGAWPEAEIVLSEGLEWATAHHHYLSALPTATLLAEVLIAQGELGRAEAHLDWAYERARAGDSRLNLLRIAVRLADVALARDQVARATQLLHEVAPVAANLRPYGGAAAEYFLASATVRAASLDWAAAQRDFQTTITINREFSLPWDEAYAHSRWSTALVTSLAPPPDEDSAWHLQEATRLWVAMGAAQYAERIEQRFLGGIGPARELAAGDNGTPPITHDPESTSVTFKRGHERASRARAREGTDVG